MPRTEHSQRRSVKGQGVHPLSHACRLRQRRASSGPTLDALAVLCNYLHGGSDTKGPDCMCTWPLLRTRRRTSYTMPSRTCDRPSIFMNIYDDDNFAHLADSSKEVENMHCFIVRGFICRIHPCSVFIGIWPLFPDGANPLRTRSYPVCLQHVFKFDSRGRTSTT